MEACIVRNVKPATLFRLMNFSRQLGGQSDNLEMDVLGYFRNFSITNIRVGMF